MSLEGAWKSRGYGWYLQIDPTSYAFFDYTKHACVEFERGGIEEFRAGFEVPDQANQDHLALRIQNELSQYDFDRVTPLPEDTLYLEGERRTDLTLNFDCFCEVFRQDYAFFELRGMNWDVACAAARQKLTSNSSPSELFELFYGLIRPLHDNHVVLGNGVRKVNSEKKADVKALIQTELQLRSASIGDPYNIHKISAFINHEFLEDKATICGNGVILWGMISPGIAYLNVLKLFGLADTEAGRTATDLPARRPDHARFLKEDLQTIEVIMDRVMADLGDARAIVLDVRLNGGGFDAVGISIANRFADKKRLAFTKHARNGLNVTPKQEFYIGPSGDFQYTRPVYLLTSSRTASAGDIFAMCMRSLPHVTVVGQRSTGILSDNLKKHLPNGWFTSISNEFYCSADGITFEGLGVPVDVETPVFVGHDFQAGYHLAVNKALQLAK